MNKNLIKLAMFCTIFVLLAACGSSGEPAEGSGGDQDDGGQQPAQQATATRIPYNGPTGSVKGRLLWNELPVVGVQVRLCEDIEFLGGCVGQQYDTVTDENGIYVISGVMPMTYALVYHALDTNDWVYVSSGFFNAQDFEVVADQEVDFGDLNIVKYDVNLVGPEEEAVLSEARPALEWEPYEGAAWYEIYLTQSPGKAIFVSEQLSETSITPPNDLLTCEYTWNIEAYNANGTQIAETDGYWHFEMTGQPYSCYVTGLEPADGASVSGSNLTLTWDAHPLARSYHITLKNSDDGTEVLDYVQTDDNSYTLAEPLPAGNYEWYVSAEDETSDYFAQSDNYSFVVGP